MIVTKRSKACDFVTRVPVAYLVAAGVKVIGLYLKYWNVPYVDECERAGICVIPIWENQAGAALGGAAVGHTHGGSCYRICQRLGIPVQKSVIVAHDTDTVTEAVGWYMQAFDTEMGPYMISGYWSLKARQEVEKRGVEWDINWTPAARSWGQDPEAEIRQMPSGGFPGHPEFDVDMGIVQADFSYHNPYTNSGPVPIPPTIPQPPIQELAMTTVFNNKDSFKVDGKGVIEGHATYDDPTAKTYQTGEVKWRLMEDGTLRHLRIVEYANMAIIRETPMTYGDLGLFDYYTPPTNAPPPAPVPPPAPPLTHLTGTFSGTVS